MEKRGQWWNGRWGRLARADVLLHEDDGRWMVEHRIGGVEGRFTTDSFEDEQAARSRVAQLLAEGDSWREL